MDFHRLIAVAMASGALSTLKNPSPFEVRRTAPFEAVRSRPEVGLGRPVASFVAPGSETVCGVNAVLDPEINDFFVLLTARPHANPSVRVLSGNDKAKAGLSSASLRRCAWSRHTATTYHRYRRIARHRTRAAVRRRTPNGRRSTTEANGECPPARRRSSSESAS